MRKKNSMRNLILKFLLTRRGGNALLQAYLDHSLGEHTPTKTTFYSTISRLQKDSLIQKKDNAWIITQQGRNYVRNNRTRYTPSFIDSPFKKNAKKDLLLIFDIPEDKKLYRDWLREQLKVFGYEMIQLSVWLGPSPLPKEFLKNITELKLKKNLQMFKVNTKKR